MSSEERKAKLTEAFSRVALGGGAGAGAVVAVLAAVNPEVLGKVMASWPGAVAGIVVAGFFLIDRRAGQGVKAIREMADAQRGLTGAVQSLLGKDDRRAERLDLVVGHLARTSEETNQMLHEHIEWCKGQRG